MHEMLSDSVQMMKRVYGKTDPATDKATNHFGTYNVMEFSAISQFYAYYDQFAVLGWSHDRG